MEAAMNDTTRAWDRRLRRCRLVAAAVLAAAAGARGGAGGARAAPSGQGRYVAPGGSDAGPGTRARPWRTLQHAATEVAGGATVHVAPGSYPGPLQIDRGGSAARPVR